MRSLLVALVSLSVVGMSLPARAVLASMAEMHEQRRWVAAKFQQPVPTTPVAALVVLENHDRVHHNAFCGKPFHVGGKVYYRGLFCHAPSTVVVRLPRAGSSFNAVVGVDSNHYTTGGRGSIIFSVTVRGEERFRSDAMREGTPGVPVHVDLDGANEITLSVEDTGDGIACDQAAWAEARAVLEDGELIWLGDLPIIEGQEGVPYDARLPFSFTYGGRSSEDLLGNWPCERNERQLDDGRREFSHTYTDPKTGLTVRCVGVQYLDFPVVEWTVYLKNTGDEVSPILENVQGLDTTFQRYPADPQVGEFTLRYQRGDDCTAASYEPQRTVLRAGETQRFGPVGGRPTNHAYPFYNLAWLSEGVIIAVGWPGQWAAEFTHDQNDTLRVRAGQELTRLSLHRGEEIRTPLIVLQFWKGQWDRAQNVWRAWMRDHNMPRPGGKPVPVQLNACSSHQYHEMENANEGNQRMFLGRYLEKGIKLDYWWMDAGWYVNGKEHGWPRTGTWEIDTDRFPRGFRPITDEAHEKGVRIIVWFEPERVTPGTWLYEEHPDWLLGPDGEQKLLNMGNDDARQWLTDHVHGLLTDQGIDLYRQDFNIDPLAYWRGNDGPDRQGATENHYVSGYLSYWDELRRRHPGLLIDSCASGGRRNDVETLRRAVPLLRSDYIFEPTGQQCHTYCLSYWVPFYGTGVIATDDYTARSAMATTSVTLCWDLRREDLPYDLLRELVQLWRKTAPYRLQGDYYPLTAYSRDNGTWIGWQFDCPEVGSGIVEMFRRPDSPYEALRCPLRGLDPEAVYRVRILGEETEREMSADEMMQEGIHITIEDRPGAVTILYDKAAQSTIQ